MLRNRSSITKEDNNRCESNTMRSGFRTVTEAAERYFVGNF